jgi:DNA-binding GntR family transcriptional regulator
LLEWLVHGQAKPGQGLPLREFSSKLGMSRTPLRAAAGRLHEQGLLDYDPRYGFTVTIPTRSDLMEYFDLREMVELHAARRILKGHYLIPTELETLVQETLELAPKIVDDPNLHNRFWRLDIGFHRSLLSLSGNSRLLELWDQLVVNIRVYQLGKTAPLSRSRFETTANEHLNILQALKNGDEEATILLLTQHIRRVRESTIAFALASFDTPEEPEWLQHLGPSQRAS